MLLRLLSVQVSNSGHRSLASARGHLLPPCQLPHRREVTEGRGVEVKGVSQIVGQVFKAVVRICCISFQTRTALLTELLGARGFVWFIFVIIFWVL